MGSIGTMASSPGRNLYPAIAGAVALSALVGLAVLPRIAPGAGSFVRKPAPDVTLPVVANGEPGARMRIADLKGHPVLLDFWASWCGPCNVEAPIIDRIAKRYEKRGLVVIGVDVDDEPEVAAAFARKKGLSYAIVVDPTKEASRLYDVDKLPSLVVIDKDGQIASYTTGVVDESSLDEIVAPLLP
jgi:thiol-disulfide isomerase/thioredoxin